MILKDKKNIIRPKKRLGQNFLINSSRINQIIDSSGFKKDHHIVEIGPGLGALTIPLAEAVGHITAIEKDTQLFFELEKKISSLNLNNITLVNEDILKFDIEKIYSQLRHKIQLIGNLPYNISSPLLEKLVSHRDILCNAVFMFQFELAQRICASPGGKEYGAMSVLLQYHAKITPLLKVSKDEFFPIPKVDSMVLNFDFLTPYPRKAKDDILFKKVVRGAFSHRRKTLINSLKNILPDKEKLLSIISSCEIDPGIRAEKLSIDKFIDLSDAFMTVFP